MAPMPSSPPMQPPRPDLNARHMDLTVASASTLNDPNEPRSILSPTRDSILAETSSSQLAAAISRPWATRVSEDPLNFVGDAAQYKAATAGFAEAMLSGLTLEKALQQRCFIKLRSRPVQHIDVFIREVVTSTVRDICGAVELLLERLLVKQKFSEPLRQLMLNVANSDVDRLVSDCAAGHVARQIEAVHAEVREAQNDANAGLSISQEARHDLTVIRRQLLQHEEAVSASEARLAANFENALQERATQDHLSREVATRTASIQELAAVCADLREDIDAWRGRCERLWDAVASLEAKEAHPHVDAKAMEARLMSQLKLHEDAMTHALAAERSERTAQFQEVRGCLCWCEKAVDELRVEATTMGEATQSKLEAAMAQIECAKTEATKMAAEVGPEREKLESVSRGLETVVRDLNLHRASIAETMALAASRETVDPLIEFLALRDDCQAAMRTMYARERAKEDVQKQVTMLRDAEDERSAQMRRLRWEFDELRAHCRGARPAAEESAQCIRSDFDDLRRHVKRLGGQIMQASHNPSRPRRPSGGGDRLPPCSQPKVASTVAPSLADPRRASSEHPPLTSAESPLPSSRGNSIASGGLLGEGVCNKVIDA